MINQQLLEMGQVDQSIKIEYGDLVFDKLHIGEFDVFSKGGLKNYYLNVFDNLAVGLNIVLIHPAFDSDEMKEITANYPNFGSAWRQIDFDTFTSEEVSAKVKSNDLKLITWRDRKRLSTL